MITNYDTWIIEVSTQEYNGSINNFINKLEEKDNDK